MLQRWSAFRRADQLCLHGKKLQGKEEIAWMLVVHGRGTRNMQKSSIKIHVQAALRNC